MLLFGLDLIEETVDWDLHLLKGLDIENCWLIKAYTHQPRGQQFQSHSHILLNSKKKKKKESN